MNKQTLTEKQNWINEKLYQTTNHIQLPNKLKDALMYAIESGGKRLRPILMLSAFEAFSNHRDKIITPAVALEFIHTYSLIHDDLPAMDDDDLRRGKATLHKKFDEATAILIGDGLLTFAFQTITTSSKLEAEEKVYVLSQLSKSAGFEGMISGQFMDIEAENRHISPEVLSEIHHKKTGELIRSSVRIGAYLGGATPPQIEALDEYARYLGIIFQVQDDILDVIGSEEVIGKPVGSDESLNKSTYPQLLGMDGAIKRRDHYMLQAKKSLEEANVAQSDLWEFIELFGNRTH
ncbi:polyprenyl synthetase family protein [Alkalibacillus aidingensis]|uniref:polyprenyl synthetase family protein n=1 Tax=Alkalibacillus aidingensis TaxID=2747607 RepID=UPI002948BDA9|nr:farnesyl diphosphate synthase [Alkalibacillus aidingensis]